MNMNGSPKNQPADRIIKTRIDLSTSGMVQVSLSILDRERSCPVDVFVPTVDRDSGKTEMNLVCAKGERFKDSWWDEFENIGMKAICIRNCDVEPLTQFMIQRADSVAEDPSIPAKERLNYFGEMGSQCVRLIFGDSTRSPEQVENACMLASRTMGIILRDSEVLTRFTGISGSDENILIHSLNVSLFSMVLGRRLGLSRTRLHVLGMGALLHDVGMSKVPSEILVKRGKLSEEEYAIIHKHPTWGHQILSLSEQIPYDALNIVLCHHERSDGKGYPSGLRGGDIPFMAKIVRIVDIFDAMTSPRSYRKSHPAFLSASHLLKEAKDKQEIEILQEFIKMHKLDFVDAEP